MLLHNKFDYRSKVYHIYGVKETTLIIVHAFVTLLKVLRPGGVKALIAENISLRKQLIKISRT